MSSLAAAIAKECPSTAKPVAVGMTIGHVLYNIEYLVTLYLENDIDFQVPVPQALAQTSDLVYATIDYICHLRKADGFLTGLRPIARDVYNRNARTKQHKIIVKHVRLAEAYVNQCVLGVLGDTFCNWNPVKMQEFNQGVEQVLTGTNWNTYPVRNVMIEAKVGDWAEWLKKECEKINRIASTVNARTRC